MSRGALPGQLFRTFTEALRVASPFFLKDIVDFYHPKQNFHIVNQFLQISCCKKYYYYYFFLRIQWIYLTPSRTFISSTNFSISSWEIVPSLFTSKILKIFCKKQKICFDLFINHSIITIKIMINKKELALSIQKDLQVLLWCSVWQNVKYKKKFFHADYTLKILITPKKYWLHLKNADYTLKILTTPKKYWLHLKNANHT